MAKKKTPIVVENVIPTTHAKEIITLSDEDLAVLRRVQAELTRLKLSVANHTMKLHEIQEHLKALMTDAKVKEEEFIDEARKLTKAHGVDVDQPDQGQWNIDLNNNTLNKIG